MHKWIKSTKCAKVIQKYKTETNANALLFKQLNKNQQLIKADSLLILNKVHSKYFFLTTSDISITFSAPFCLHRLLDQAPAGATFITLCFIVRSLDALGFAAAMTSSFAITAKIFPNNVATVLVRAPFFCLPGMLWRHVTSKLRTLHSLTCLL